jgi:hypothetical protein
LQSRLKSLAITITTLVTLAACGGTPAPTATPLATRTPRPTETPAAPTVLAPTLARVASTPTAAAPSATPPFQRWTSAQVVDAFRAAGIEVSGARAMTAEDYGPAPQDASDGMIFSMPSVGEGRVCRVFSFSTPSALETLRAFYVEPDSTIGIYFSWLYTRGNILLRVDGKVPEDVAKKYEAVLEGMK